MCLGRFARFYGFFCIFRIYRDLPSRSIFITANIISLVIYVQIKRQIPIARRFYLVGLVMIVFKRVYMYVWILLQDFEVKYGSSNKESFQEVKNGHVYKWNV